MSKGVLRTLELLVIADVHYVGHARHTCPIPSRRAQWGGELVQRVVERARRETRLDAVVLLGDLVDNGHAWGVKRDLQILHQHVQTLGIPLLVVPGNHDGDARRLARIFGDPPGVHRLNGYRLVTFADAYTPDDRATRKLADLAMLRSVAEETSSEPIVCLQHNPIYPHIESSYPYNLVNAAEVMQAYERAGVLLSISAHYHPGLAPVTVNGVQYLTCPALCESPMRFLRVSLRGRQVTIGEVALSLEGLNIPLIDCHSHTHYAYCSEDVSPPASIERAEALGLAGIVFTEHAGQLYLPAHAYWEGMFRRKASVIPAARSANQDRIRRYREEMRAYRSDKVGVGLEVELDAEGRLTLLAEDYEGWDVLIGAVHALRHCDGEGATEAQVASAFMRETEELTALGIDILAHPFRFFRRAGRPVPRRLYRRVAELLATYGVAAEVNYHTNEPDPDFFALCLEHNVKLSLGTDSHALHEVGELGPHLDLLRKIVSPDQLPDVLFTPTLGG